MWPLYVHVYRSMRDDDGALREKLRELANQRCRFEYRRLHILLRLEGVMINKKKTQRLYREEAVHQNGVDSELSLNVQQKAHGNRRTDFATRKLRRRCLPGIPTPRRSVGETDHLLR